MKLNIFFDFFLVAIIMLLMAKFDRRKSENFSNEN